MLDSVDASRSRDSDGASRPRDFQAWSRDVAGRMETALAELLPPAHIAVVPKERMLTGLDELFTILPRPAEVSSSLVLITGPSRTADIEQILVRGVHGPGQVTVVIVG